MRLGRGNRDEAPAATSEAELPDHGEMLNLRTGTGEELPARVLERDAGSLLIAITVPVQALSPRALESVEIEYGSDNGRSRMQGRATVENPADPDILRIDQPRSAEVVQQREFVRISTTQPVVLYIGRDMLQMESFTLDLSGGGFLLAGPDTLQIGESVSFQLTLSPEEEPVSGRATVVRVDPMGHRGVSFVEISDSDQRRVVRFIFECQRHELQRGLKGGGGGR